MSNPAWARLGNQLVLGGVSAGSCRIQEVKAAATLMSSGYFYRRRNRLSERALSHPKVPKAGKQMERMPPRGAGGAAFPRCQVQRWEAGMS